MERNRHLRVIEDIDKGIEEAAAITVEQSLGHAVLHGVMTIEEATLCLEAYERSFHPDDAA